MLLLRLAGLMDRAVAAECRQRSAERALELEKQRRQVAEAQLARCEQRLDAALSALAETSPIVRSWQGGAIQ